MSTTVTVGGETVAIEETDDGFEATPASATDDDPGLHYDTASGYDALDDTKRLDHGVDAGLYKGQPAIKVGHDVLYGPSDAWNELLPKRPTLSVDLEKDAVLRGDEASTMSGGVYDYRVEDYDGGHKINFTVEHVRETFPDHTEPDPSPTEKELAERVADALGMSTSDSLPRVQLTYSGGFDGQAFALVSLYSYGGNGATNVKGKDLSNLEDIMGGVAYLVTVPDGESDHGLTNKSDAPALGIVFESEK